MCRTASDIIRGVTSACVTLSVALEMPFAALVSLVTFLLFVRSTRSSMKEEAMAVCLFVAGAIKGLGGGRTQRVDRRNA